MSDGVVNLRAISTSLTTKLMSDESFRKDFQQDPRGALKTAGLPEQMIPPVISTAAVEETLRRVDGLKAAGKTRSEEAIAVACVVI
jgi:hypothetical protein